MNDALGQNLLKGDRVAFIGPETYGGYHFLYEGIVVGFEERSNKQLVTIKTEEDLYSVSRMNKAVVKIGL